MAYSTQSTPSMTPSPYGTRYTGPSVSPPAPAPPADTVSTAEGRWPRMTLMPIFWYEARTLDEMRLCTQATSATGKATDATSTAAAAANMASAAVVCAVSDGRHAKGIPHSEWFSMDVAKKYAHRSQPGIPPSSAQTRSRPCQGPCRHTHAHRHSSTHTPRDMHTQNKTHAHIHTYTHAHTRTSVSQRRSHDSLENAGQLDCNVPEETGGRTRAETVSRRH